MKNIIYIHTHDTGKFTSVYGKNVPTPTLKEFSEDALVFRNAFCASPTCSPSRGALLTGRYPHENGLQGLAHRGFSIGPSSMHLAEFLRQKGYETVLCGVQHESRMYDYTEKSLHYSDRLGYEKNLSYVGDEQGTLSKAEADHINALRTAEYLMTRKNDRPFFYSFGMFHTHREYPEVSQEERKTLQKEYIELPFNVFDTEEAREDTLGLYKSLKQFDDNFAIVLEALKESGHYEDTIIISTTDHGLANPLSKCTLMDSGMAVSLIVRIPGFEESYGTWYRGLVSHVDLFPTLCDVLNLDPPENLSGVSLLPAFKGEKEDLRDAVYAEINFHTSYEPARCVRSKRYKYICFYDKEWDKYNMTNCDDSAIKTFLVDAGWRNKKKPSEQLYDLYFDPTEKNNVVDDPEYREILLEMRSKLERWRVDTKDKILQKEDYMGHCKLNRKDDLSPTVKNQSQLESVIETPFD